MRPKSEARKFRGETGSLSEIEFCTLYVVPERWIFGCMLRFVHANNHFSDTLRSWHFHETLSTKPVFHRDNDPSKRNARIAAIFSGI